MIAGIARGLVAGAAGATALNVLTYLDMAARARPPSPVPKQTAQGLADSLDTGLVADSRRPPVPLGAGGLTLAAMAGANVPAVATGVTEPQEWSPQAWAAGGRPGHRGGHRA